MATRRWRGIRTVCFALLALLIVAIGAVVVHRHQERRAILAALEAGSVQQRSSTNSIPVGSSEQTIESGGLKRDFIVYRPQHVSNPAPLVLMLHGGYGSAAGAEKTYGWNQLADSDHFIVVYPDGYDHAWNAGAGCCGKPAADNVNDVAFITAVVKRVEGEIPIARSRVYATGMSNGGIMVYTLACKTSIFAAIGPVAATQLGSCKHPHELSVIHIHGTADTHVPYNGGPGDNPPGAPIDGPAIPALNKTWRGIDHCKAPKVTTKGVVKTSVAACPHHRSVELISIIGAGHQWPGSPNKPLQEELLHTDPPSQAINATATIWRFFKSHPA
jgi:polyhydroxybutyrate depolymerase